MLKRPRIILSVLFAAGFSCLHAQKITDTAAFANQVFGFFKTNPYQKRSGFDKTIRNSDSPLWYEYAAPENFTGFKNVRRRYRKAACYKLNELVFSLDTVTDRQLTRDWNQEKIESPHIARLLDAYDGLAAYFGNDSVQYETVVDIISPKMDKQFNEKAYRKQLFLPDPYLLIYITYRESGIRILLRVMAQALPGDTYELQLVLSTFEDSCVGI